MDFVRLEDRYGELRVLFAPDIVAPPRASHLERQQILQLVEAFSDGTKGWPREVCPLQDYSVGVALSLWSC